MHNIDAIDIACPESDQQLLAINEALEKLAEKDPRAARIVEMRYFTGLTHSEIAKVLGIDRRTVDREWSVTRAWLFGQVSNS